MTETFSEFASQYVLNRIKTACCVLNAKGVRQSEIMAMGWEHLHANLETEKTTELIQEIIQSMGEGNAVHQADGLKFGLYDALRQKGAVNYPFARLQCPDAGCAWHHDPVSYVALGNSLCCTRHKRWSSGSAATSKVMVCSECGHARADRCTWCKGCRRIFK